MLPLHNGNSNKLRWEWVKMLPLHHGNSQNFRVGMGLKCYHYTVETQNILLWKEVKMLPLHCGNSTNLGGVKMLPIHHWNSKKLLFLCSAYSQALCPLVLIIMQGCCNLWNIRINLFRRQHNMQLFKCTNSKNF